MATMNEAMGQDKGANGRIAEYACAYFLAAALKQAGLKVSSDVNQLRTLAQQEQAKYAKSLTTQQIQVATDAGNAMGKSMYESIVTGGDDLVFVNYAFDPGQHTFDIEPTGAQQNKGSTDDLVIHLTKDGAEAVQHKILLSLKVSGSSANSQGSKGPLPLLWKLFVDPAAKTVKPADFVSHFGAKGQEFVDALEDFKRAGKEFLDSPEGQDWARRKEADRLARGKDPKKAKVKADTNFYRAKEVGDYYVKTRGHTPEHKLSELFVALYNQGSVNLNSGNWKQFNEGFKQAIGFDEVITYKTICDQQGVKEVVSSATSKAYKDMYRALNEKINVVLTARPGSSGIGVRVQYGNTVLESLTCSIWKDGTIQFKFDSAE
jgi:hypothetical protein